MYRFSFCFLSKTFLVLVDFGRACAPVRCAHPSFLAHCHPKRGAARPPPCPSQLRCFSVDPQKYIKSIELKPPIVASLILPAIFCGQPVFSFLYSSWIFSFCYSLLFFLSFLFPSYPSFLISSYSSRRYYSSSSYSSFLVF